MKLKELLFLGILAALTMSLLSCGSKKFILHPITDRDIYYKDNGDICFSEYYFNEILKFKIENNL